MRHAIFNVTVAELDQAERHARRIILAAPSGNRALAAESGAVLNEILVGLEPGNPDDFETLARRLLAVVWMAGFEVRGQAAILASTALMGVATPEKYLANGRPDT